MTLSETGIPLTFTNQIAVVTGAASGLGLAISKKLASLGAKLVLLDKEIDSLTTQPALAEMTRYAVDITNEEKVSQTIQKIGDQFGQIDILINSAGITGITNIKSHETDASNVRQVFDVNFMGSYFTSKHVLPWMLKKRYGRILHIASIAGKEGNAGMLAYSSSKAAVIGMTKVQGKEYAESGITVNALAPAVVQTALVDAMPPEQVRYMTDKIPMKRCGTLDEVANLSIYIVSPMNSFTTGFTFDLTGGRATY
ncbi:SDR family NAD(P)-dependent oxidoreductase [Chryseolinea sp. T2]|uniref:SDR family NAD(P)-dependent oxidoreductase n=1 Tax=Chryseolinea sp. T2 TaxID=3129255 RepID=UPI0030769066